jgi:hypothetical protein
MALDAAPGAKALASQPIGCAGPSDVAAADADMTRRSGRPATRAAHDGEYLPTRRRHQRHTRPIALPPQKSIHGLARRLAPRARAAETERKPHQFGRTRPHSAGHNAARPLPGSEQSPGRPAPHGEMAQIRWQASARQLRKTLPLKPSHPRSAACRWLRLVGTGQGRLRRGNAAILQDHFHTAAVRRRLTRRPFASQLVSEDLLARPVCRAGNCALAGSYSASRSGGCPWN